MGAIGRQLLSAGLKHMLHLQTALAGIVDLK